jgi:hypothetical protein
MKFVAQTGLIIRDPFRQRLVKWYKGGKPGSFKHSSKVNERQGDGESSATELGVNHQITMNSP